MSTLREKIKAALPAPVLGALRESRDWAVRAGQWPSAALHPWRRDSIERLNALRDSRKGERCFILGNGPSLQKTDLSRLKGEFTFGMNRIYMAFEQMGFPTSCIVTVNDLVMEQCCQDFQALDVPLFVSWRARRWLTPKSNIHYLFTTYTGPKFARDAAGRIWESATVTNVALQLAYHLGFSTVVLIGVDHNFVTQGKPNTTVVSQGDDPNHFNPGYFGKGFRWQLPDLDTSEIGYALARQAFEADGRQVLDATIGGKCQIFPKVDYDSLF